MSMKAIPTTGKPATRIRKRYKTRDAVQYLKDSYGVSYTPGTFEVWRSQGKGPSYVRIGRNIFYPEEALDKFAEGQPVLTTDSQ